MSKLEEMLRYVSVHNDFYKNRIKEYGIKDPLDITQWPILTSSDIENIQHSNNFSDVLEKVVYSSGSSGLAKRITWTYRDYEIMCLNAWRLRRRWYHINPKMKTLHFYGSLLYNDIVDFQHIERDFYTTDNELFVNYMFFYNELDNAAKIINEFLPEIVFAFPSNFLTLLENSQMDEWKNNLKYIELYGENITDDQITKIREIIPHAQYSIMYGTTETGVVAITCPNMHMHIVEQNCYVESINSHLVLTSLTNTRTPFIRYYIGDIGILEYDECKCGLTSHIIADLKGREPGSIITSDHKHISSTVIPEYVNLINAEYSCSIISYYAEQLVPGELIVYIDLSESFYTWKDTIIAKLKSYLATVIFNMKSINVVTGIPQILKKRNYYTCRCSEYETR